MTDSKQYPDLPQKHLDALLDHIYEHGTTSEGVLKRVESMLRAYVDADRAMRGSEVMQATEDKLKEWQADGTLFERVIGALEQQEREIMRLEKALAEQPQEAAPSQDAVAIEREACAALAESQWTNDVERLYGRMVAAMIRAKT